MFWLHHFLFHNMKAAVSLWMLWYVEIRIEKCLDSRHDSRGLFLVLCVSSCSDRLWEWIHLWFWNSWSFSRRSPIKCEMWDSSAEKNFKECRKAPCRICSGVFGQGLMTECSVGELLRGWKNNVTSNGVSLSTGHVLWLHALKIYNTGGWLVGSRAGSHQLISQIGLKLVVVYFSASLIDLYSAGLLQNCCQLLYCSESFLLFLLLDEMEFIKNKWACQF